MKTIPKYIGYGNNNFFIYRYERKSKSLLFPHIYKSVYPVTNVTWDVADTTLKSESLKKGDTEQEVKELLMLEVL